MKERPILMKGELVCATLEDLKSQTRRVMRPQPDHTLGYKQLPAVSFEQVTMCGEWVARGRDGQPTASFPAGKECLRSEVRCPYGVAGDRLWVRETFGLREMAIDFGAGPEIHDETVYRATAPGVEVDRWRPSIHMPRDLSRIDLEVTTVRVERVHAITPEDAIAEGCGPIEGIRGGNPRAWFAGLWDTISAKPKPVYGRVDGERVILHYESFPWEDIRETREHRGKPWHVYGNPWVFVIGFRRVTG